MREQQQQRKEEEAQTSLGETSADVDVSDISDPIEPFSSAASASPPPPPLGDAPLFRSAEPILDPAAGSERAGLFHVQFLLVSR